MSERASERPTTDSDHEAFAAFVDETSRSSPTIEAVAERPAARTLVTTRDLARALGLSEAHARRKAREGQIPVAKIDERGVRYFDVALVSETITTRTRSLTLGGSGGSGGGRDDAAIAVEAFRLFEEGVSPIDVTIRLAVAPTLVEKHFAAWRRMKRDYDDQRAAERRDRMVARMFAASHADARREEQEERASARRPSNAKSSPSPVGPPSRIGPTRSTAPEPGSAKWMVETWLDDGTLDPSAGEHIDEDSIDALAKRLGIGRESARKRIVEWRVAHRRNVRHYPIGHDLWHAAVQRGGPTMIDMCAPVLAEARGVEIEVARNEIVRWQAAHPLAKTT